MYCLDMASKSPTRRSLREAGRFIQEERRERGLTPEALAFQISSSGLPISGRTIRRIEAGECRPTVRTMFALANAFDVEVRDLWPL